MDVEGTGRRKIMAENQEFTPEELKAALKAFKKRLKILRRDDESSLSRGAMTEGRRSGIAGVRPPEQFTKEIWAALEEQGKMRYIGSGLYELA
jgi:hypothetical protein